MIFSEEAESCREEGAGKKEAFQLYSRKLYSAPPPPPPYFKSFLSVGRKKKSPFQLFNWESQI